MDRDTEEDEDFDSEEEEDDEEDKSDDYHRKFSFCHIPYFAFLFINFRIL